MNKVKTFEWNDELVSELLWSRFPFPEGVTAVKPILEEFKKEKLEQVNKLIVSKPFEDAVNKKVYSQKEYLQFGQECFNAARKNNTEWYFKYKNFSDYMNIKSEVNEK